MDRIIYNAYMIPPTTANIRKLVDTNKLENSKKKLK